MSEPTKRCCRCKKIKPLKGFCKNRIIPDGYSRECKVCQAKRSREYYLKNKSKMNAKGKEYYQNNKPGFKKRQRKNELKRYGLTLADYDEMFEKQNGVCAICDLPEIMTRLAVDHDHKTGKVRKLLCRRCNTVLGHVEENIDLLLKTVEYIKENQKCLNLQAD